ncbi:hypothetical protein H0H87_009264 [Tephrocybe sp. NHM501043]|nr:hypothetical protein H0H87_009264 [Tephrocybe sp. NHM501043]
MCKGLKARRQTSSAVFTFTDDAKVKANNRAQAGCAGSPCGTGTTGTSCDEVRRAQNIQGGVISRFKQINNIKSGMHYTFQITNYDCATGKGLSVDIAAADGVLGVPGESLQALERRDLIPGGPEDGESRYPLDARRERGN